MIFIIAVHLSVLLCRLGNSPSLLPLFPTRLTHIFLHYQIPEPERPCQRRLKRPAQPASLPRNSDNHKPPNSAYHTGDTAHDNLLRGVVVQVHPAPRCRRRNRSPSHAHCHSLENTPGPVHAAVCATLVHAGRLVTDEQEQR
jgi:hypothetical protein